MDRDRRKALIHKTIVAWVRLGIGGHRFCLKPRRNMNKTILLPGSLDGTDSHDCFYRSLVDQMPDPVTVVDDAGNAVAAPFFSQALQANGCLAVRRRSGSGAAYSSLSTRTTSTPCANRSTPSYGQVNRRPLSNTGAGIAMETGGPWNPSPGAASTTAARWPF